MYGKRSQEKGRVLYFFAAMMSPFQGSSAAIALERRPSDADDCALQGYRFGSLKGVITTAQDASSALFRSFPQCGPEGRDQKLFLAPKFSIFEPP